MPMNNSNKSDEWIAAVVAANPIKILANGNIVTCPVRLQWADLLTPAKDSKNDDGTVKAGKFGCTPLFPPCATSMVEKIIRPQLLMVAKTNFASRFDAETGEPSGLHFPIRGQEEKVGEQEGFTRGGVFCGVSTQFQPPVYDSAMNPITDPKRIYNGVWAILALNVYPFTSPKKRGVSLGLQMAMIFADDTKLLSKKADPKNTFGGVKMDAAYTADAAFGEGTVQRTGGGAQSQQVTDAMW